MFTEAQIAEIRRRLRSPEPVTVPIMVDNADKLDGLHASAFAPASHLHAEYVPVVRLISAGDGLTGGGDLSAHRTLSVDETVVRTSRSVTGAGALGGGGSLAADLQITLNLPGTLSAASVNASTTNHTHAVTASANPGAAESLLKTDAAGKLTLAGLAVAGVDSHLLPTTPDTYDLGSSTRLWRKGWLSELDAVLFARNTASLVGGWLIVPKGSGTLPADVAGTDTQIDFGQALTVGDVVVIRAALKVEYLRVGTLVSGTTYNVTRDLDGTGANDWPAGTPYMVLGQAGDGRIELDAQSGGPRISVIEQGATYDAQTERVRLGDLDGWLGLGLSGYGWGVGEAAKHAYYTPADGLVVRGRIEADEGYLGDLSIEGLLGIGTDGELRQGTGTLGTDFTGLRLWREGDIGRIAGYSGDVQEWYAGTDGKLYAGGGAVVLDKNGLTLGIISGAFHERYALKFVNPITGIRHGHISMSSGAAGGSSYLIIETENGLEGQGIILQAAVDRSITIDQGMGTTVEGALRAAGGLNVGTATGAAAGEVRASGQVTGATGLRTTSVGRLWLERPISGGTRAFYTEIDTNGHLGLYRATDGVYAGTQVNFLTDGSTRFQGSVGVNDGNRFVLDVNSGNDTYIRKWGGNIEFYIDGTLQGYLHPDGWKVA